MTKQLQSVIDLAWDRRDAISADTKGETRDAVDAALELLDSGEARVAESVEGGWQVNQWLKKAVLLSFRLNAMAEIPGGPGGAAWWDKVDSKFKGWDAERFTAAGFRAVPGAIVRKGAYIAPNAVLMPSFVNLGAYVGEGTMIDTWATVGSCAQIGKNVHISGGTGIGWCSSRCRPAGDLEMIALSALGLKLPRGCGRARRGYFDGCSSAHRQDRRPAHRGIQYGRVPAYSVVVPGTLPARDGGPSLACAVIVKQVDEKTRSKTSINELLRD